MEKGWVGTKLNRRVCLAAVFIAWAFPFWRAGPAWAGETAAPAEQVAKEPKKKWFSPMKDIGLGPGKLSFDVNVRSRYEWTDNFDIRGYDTGKDDHLLLQRTQLGMDYRLKQSLADAHFYVQIQDSRFWSRELDRGDFQGSCSHFDQLDLRQAYVEYQHIAETPLGFKVGRQNIVYADTRVWGPGDWGNVGGYWWDAAKLCLDVPQVKVDLLYARRIESEQTRMNMEHYPFHVGGLYAQIRQLPLKLDVFYVLKYDSSEIKGERSFGDEERHSFGFYADYKRAGFELRSTMVGQLGRCGGDDVQAFGCNASAGYTIDAPWRPYLGAQFDYATGDGNPSDGKSRTFQGVFAGGGSMYGWINFVGWKNMRDERLLVKARPRPNLELMTEFHTFHLASAEDAWYWCSGKSMRRDKTGQSGTSIGQEIDFVVKARPLGYLEILTSYSRFFPGSFLRNTPGGHDPANTFLMQVTLKF